MNNKITRYDILNYYDNLINKIDTFSEHVLSKQFLSDDLKLSINQERKLMLSKNHSFEENAKILDNNSNSKLPFYNNIAKLIILKTQIDEDLLEEIEIFITQNREPDSYFFESFTELLKYNIIIDLVETKFNDLIIDLSNPEINTLRTIEFTDDSYRFKRIKLKNIQFIQLLINPNSVEILRTNIEEIYPFPDYFSLFANIKTLEIYKAIWEYLPSNGFSNLKFLETLLIESRELKFIQEDVFKGLNYLKSLSIRESYIKMFHRDTFKDLDCLQELTIVNGKEIESLDLSYLRSLKHLYLRGRRNRLVLNSHILKDLTNLTVVDLEESYMDHIPAETFQSLKFLKSLNVSNRQFFLYDEPILINYDFLKPLKNLEYLSVTVTENLFNYFNQVKMPSLKYLWMNCKCFKILENNFENLVTLKIDLLEKLEPGCFNKLNDIKNLILNFRETESLVNVDSTYFKRLDNLDFLRTEPDYMASFEYLQEKGEFFLKMFDEKKKLENTERDYFTVYNSDTKIDLYLGLSDETKQEVIKYD
ncbi:unnamed protein product [Brachionus calyciflorus]|uniref:Uncharacterized protein n=1 Tax=Brachionus calyciflorus TaxID=104777 RepID=A0A814M141_9BILA|nr:unnamed protein product [Brachionus calyciflorus]